MVDKAGATIVEETGEMKVKHETNSVDTHFLGRLQLRGFAGSFGPDQVTYYLSAAEIPSNPISGANGTYKVCIVSRQQSILLVRLSCGRVVSGGGIMLIIVIGLCKVLGKLRGSTPMLLIGVGAPAHDGNGDAVVRVIFRVKL